jgi:Terminase DNA packaging enzyme
MSKLDDNLSDLLDIPVTPAVDFQQSAPVPVESKTDGVIEHDLMQDYNDSRRRLREIVTKGTDAIDDILAIARESEHPRAFEVASKLIDSVTNANEKLLGIQKQMKDIRNVKNQAQTTIGKAAIFVGSTAELSKMLKGNNDMKTIDGE